MTKMSLIIEFQGKKKDLHLQGDEKKLARELEKKGILKFKEK